MSTASLESHPAPGGTLGAFLLRKTPHKRCRWVPVSRDKPSAGHQDALPRGQEPLCSAPVSRSRRPALTHPTDRAVTGWVRHLTPFPPPLPPVPSPRPPPRRPASPVGAPGTAPRPRRQPCPQGPPSRNVGRAAARAPCSIHILQLWRMSSSRRVDVAQEPHVKARTLSGIPDRPEAARRTLPPRPGHADP